MDVSLLRLANEDKHRVSNVIRVFFITAELYYYAQKPNIICKTFRSCGLHQKHRQRFSYATNMTEADVALLRLALKDKHRACNVTNVDIVLLMSCIVTRRMEVR